MWVSRWDWCPGTGSTQTAQVTAGTLFEIVAPIALVRRQRA